MKYNICIPTNNNPFSWVFFELAELIGYSLRELSIDTTIQFQKIEMNRRNIVIGPHLLDIKLIGALPKSTILLNTEQLGAASLSGVIESGPRKTWDATVFGWAKHYELWDYSKANIGKFNAQGLFNVRFLGLGYQKELMRIGNASKKDIDILFYGSLEPNDRRTLILQQLRAAGLNVPHVFGVFGPQRDSLIARSKLVLNIHFFDTQIFECVRVFYLLHNSIPVVSEIGATTSIEPHFRAAVFPSAYNDLVESCLKFISNEDLRHALGAKGYSVISKFPQSQFTAPLIAPLAE